MAYGTKYQINFNTDQSDEITIFLKKKNTTFPSVVTYAASDCRLKYTAGDGKFAWVWGMSAEVTFNLLATDPDYWPDFEYMEQDTWQMVIMLGSYTLFVGYVLPDLGESPFQDKPYDAKLTAVDQIGLIKDVLFRKIDGTEFRGEHLVIELLAAALQATGLQLPIRVYDNVYHASMLNRDDDPKWDFMGQAKLEYRTFLKDAVTFVSAREVLEIICNETYRLFQWAGQWVIIRLSLLQYWPGERFYTIYDASGLNAVGFSLTEDYASVGKEQLIYPINETQIKTYSLAVKETRTFYNYIVWPEIPKNNRFDLGTVVETRDAEIGDLMFDIQGQYESGDIGPLSNYTITDWEYGTNTAGDLGKMTIVPNGQTAYRTIIKDNFEHIVDDHLTLATGPQISYFHSTSIPVRVGDKLNFNVSFRTHDDFADPTDINPRYTIARVYMVADNGDTLGLTSDGEWHSGERSEVVVDYSIFDDTRHTKTVTFQSKIAPKSGTVYITFIADSIGGPYVYFQDFDFTLGPYVAGSYKPLKGDHLLRRQNKKLPDATSNEIRISDTDHKIFKGCLLNGSGVPYTSDWYRFGFTEHQHFKNFSNLGRFNMEYKRGMIVDGDFTGVTFSAINEQDSFQPFGLHKPYRLADLSEDRRCIVTAPVEIDLWKGDIKARFEEVYLGGSDPQDGTFQGDFGEFKYDF